MKHSMDIINDDDPPEIILSHLGRDLNSIDILGLIGVSIDTNKAYQAECGKLPLWRRLFWPRLTLAEKQRAILRELDNQNV